MVWFSEHKKDFISATLTGVPVLGASHLAAYYPAQKLVNIHTMHDVVNVLSEGPVWVSLKGSVLNIGGLTLQRKGGTPDPSSLQVKLSAKQLIRVPVLFKAVLD